MDFIVCIQWYNCNLAFDYKLLIENSFEYKD